MVEGATPEELAVGALWVVPSKHDGTIHRPDGSTVTVKSRHGGIAHVISMAGDYALNTRGRKTARVRGV